MRTLRVRSSGSAEGRAGEVFCCHYSSDGAFVLSASWDGCLRLWLSATGQPVSVLPASVKPLSCCAFAPDGGAWLAGSMEGLLGCWDAVTHRPQWSFVAHIRPLSAVAFAPDGSLLATASWDRKLMLRRVGDECEGRSLSGHHDIVAGCRWLPDSRQLLSWSHDGTLRLWDAEGGCEVGRLRGHADRVTAAGVSADGKWAVSGGRDGVVKLWDLMLRAELRSLQLNAEVRDCWCLRDGSAVLTITADGWIVLWSLPDFQVQAELASGLRPLCSDLAPSGTELVVGDDSGRLHFVAIQGIEEAPLWASATPLFKPRSGVITRFLGKKKVERSYQYACPKCGHGREVSQLPSEPISCPGCQRLLRVTTEELQLQAQ